MSVLPPDAAPPAPPPPPQLTAPPRGAVLALAPHPDDETLGCGGALALHAQRGDAVRVVVISDGAAGDPGGLFAGGYVERREAEARQALRCLGVCEVEFLRLPDGRLSQDERLHHVVRELLERLQPDVVYGPSPAESHPDHWAVARAIERALAGRDGAEWWAYEIWTPLRASHLVNVGPVWERKERAIRCYETQLRYIDYLRRMEGLARYRTLHAPALDHAEAFDRRRPGA